MGGLNGINPKEKPRRYFLHLSEKNGTLTRRVVTYFVLAHSDAEAIASAADRLGMVGDISPTREEIIFVPEGEGGR